MTLEPRPFVERKRMTRLGEATAKRLRSKGAPIIASRDLFLILDAIYEEGAVAYLRGDAPSHATFIRVRDLLRSEKVISRDEDYPGLWRVNTVADLPAEEVVCIADPCLYISHFSAMQRYGLTNRRPTSLHLTQSTQAGWKEWVKANIDSINEAKSVPINTTRPRHPPTVRGRHLHVLNTEDFGHFTQLKNSFSRMASIGQTFMDMLKDPELCGGMSHVVDVFDQHASTYSEDIIRVIDERSLAITKVRAGYLLEERLGIHSEKVRAWRRWAQRGGSRKLDPHKPYAPTFSETWMLSLNA